MRKFIGLLLVLAIAAPSFAAVTIECNDLGDGVVAIEYSGAAAAAKPRAIALVLTVDNGAVITDVNDLGKEGVGYAIYPGTIAISGGSVQEYNTPLAPNTDPGAAGTGLNTASVVLEMGSLHWPADYGSVNAPPESGTLCEITVDADCNLTIAEEDTFRGGIVLYNAEGETGASLLGCNIEIVPAVVDCFDSGHADYGAWVTAGKPDCWCYEYQCEGDADGLQLGNPKDGYFYVENADLTLLLNSWKITSGVNVCADFTRSTDGNPKDGYFQVENADLTILLNHWKNDGTLVGGGSCGGTDAP